VTAGPPGEGGRSPSPIELPDLVGTSVPFNRPNLQGDELRYMQLSVEHGHTSADGPFSAAVAQLLRDEIGSADILLTTSCTAALELSAMLLDVGPGDTVVVPSFGFVTTALAYTRQGARVLFCDIERETLGLDPDHLAELMDPSVRAVVPIHYSGVGCDLDGIEKVLAEWPRADLVEDNAHGLFGGYRGRPLGSIGRLATLSFHETKNFTCGEGGAILINRPEDVARAHVLYHKGTNRSAFLHGLVDKYTWQDTGSSFGLSDVLAAYLYAAAGDVPVLGRIPLEMAIRAASDAGTPPAAGNGPEAQVFAELADKVDHWLKR
jgi:dTDP-4-amino-4,6-dideoxygalactose transaminase